MKHPLPRKERGPETRLLHDCQKRVEEELTYNPFLRDGSLGQFRGVEFVRSKAFVFLFSFFIEDWIGPSFRLKSLLGWRSPLIGYPCA